jgi:hypothetical protein
MYFQNIAATLIKEIYSMGFLTDLINNHPELLAVKNELSAAEARFEALEAENRQRKRELAGRPTPTPAPAEPQPFTLASGVLWKKKKPLGHESMPYCPTCKAPLADYAGSLLCLKCNWQAPIKSFEVPKVYHDLFGPS